MFNQQDDEFQIKYERALVQLEQGDYEGALATVQKAMDALWLENVLNASLNAPKILEFDFSCRSLNFEQSVQFTQLELLKARIHEPLQQEGAWFCTVECIKRCKLLISYAAKNKMPEQQVQIEKLLNEATSYQTHIAKLLTTPQSSVENPQL